MKTQFNHQSAVRVHQHLAKIIKERFGVFLEVQHLQYPNGHRIRKHEHMFRAVTHVWAYHSLDDARNFREPITRASAYCGMSDQFVRAEGLVIAMRRLYRQLANQAR